jgi:hypothetical protein
LEPNKVRLPPPLELLFEIEDADDTWVLWDPEDGVEDDARMMRLVVLLLVAGVG